MIEITKQDMLILLQGGGILEKTYEDLQISPTPKKILEKSTYPVLIKIISNREFLVSFNGERFVTPAFFKKQKTTVSDVIVNVYEFIVHKGEELYIKNSGRATKIESIAVFVIPQYILQAPSIKQVEIQNTFNIPLEEQNVR